MVQDINDNPPVFSQDLYSVSVVENNQPGLALLRLDASDADASSTFHYWLSCQENFHIDRMGLISVTSSLDRESATNYTFTAFVRDDDTPPSFTATTQVRVLVVDENDEKPLFSSPEYVFSLHETFSSPFHPAQPFLPRVVGKVEVTDKDLYPFNQSFFDILPYNNDDNNNNIDNHNNNYNKNIENNNINNNKNIENNHNNNNNDKGDSKKKDGTPLSISKQKSNKQQQQQQQQQYSFLPFRINHTTGVIDNTHPLDREIQATHRFKIVASDSVASKTLYSIADVIVKVLDLNDEAPIFSEPKNPFLLDDEGRNEMKSKKSEFSHKCTSRRNSSGVKQPNATNHRGTILPILSTLRADKDGKGYTLQKDSTMDQVRGLSGIYVARN